MAQVVKEVSVDTAILNFLADAGADLDVRQARHLLACPVGPFAKRTKIGVIVNGDRGAPFRGTVGAKQFGSELQRAEIEAEVRCF